MTTLTNQIFQLSAPYDNPYQGKDKRVLFICSAGILRSATAANIYGNKGFNTRSAGSSPLALVPLTVNLIAWAQKIVFVNAENYNEALQTFDDSWAKQKLLDAVVLDIPDQFPYKDPTLISLLETSLEGKL